MSYVLKIIDNSSIQHISHPLLRVERRLDRLSTFLDQGQSKVELFLENVNGEGILHKYWLLNNTCVSADITRINSNILLTLSEINDFKLTW